MTNRRDFLKSTGAVALGAAMPAMAIGHDKLEIHSRPIPGTGENLPIVGLGNARVFQEGDLAAVRRPVEIEGRIVFAEMNFPRLCRSGIVGHDINAGPADTGDDRYFIQRDVEIEIFQVVLAGTFYSNRFVFHRT